MLYIVVTALFLSALIYRFLTGFWLFILTYLILVTSSYAVDYSYMIRAALKSKEDYKTFMNRVGNDQPIRIVLKNSSGTTLGDYSIRAGGPYVDYLRAGGNVNSSPVDWGSLPEGENTLNDYDGSELKVYSYVTPSGGRAFFHYTYTMPAEGSLPSQIGIADPLNPGDTYTNASDYGGNGPWYKNYGSRLYVIYSVIQSGTNSVGTPIWQIKYRDYYKGTGYGGFTADEAGNLNAVEPDSYPEIIEKSDNILNDFDGQLDSTPEEVDFEVEIDSSTFEGDGYYDQDGNLIEVPSNDVEEQEGEGNVIPDSERNDWTLDTPTGTKKTDPNTALLQDILKKLGDIEEGLYSSGSGSGTSNEVMPGVNEYVFTEPEEYDEDLNGKTFVEIFQEHYEKWLEMPIFESFNMPELSLGGTLPSYDLSVDLGISRYNGALDFEQYREWFEILGLFFYFVCCWRAFEIIF